MIALHVILRAKRVEVGDYIVYVFENLDEPETYLMCTKLPNWNIAPIEIGDKGFIQVKEVIAGVDSWFNVSDNTQVPYRYDGVYLTMWVKEQEKNLKTFKM